MSDTPGYLYTIVVEVLSKDGSNVSDVYRMKYGTQEGFHILCLSVCVCVHSYSLCLCTLQCPLSDRCCCVHVLLLLQASEQSRRAQRGAS